MIDLTRADARLDQTASGFAGEPFIDETVQLLQAVRERDLDALLGMGDEDFSVVEVDVDPAGDSPQVRVRPEWEPWFRRFFLLLDALNASTDSEITAYRAISSPELGYSVVEFRQHVVATGYRAVFDCIATIVWKLTDDGWREARWHCSIIDRQIDVHEPADAPARAADGDVSSWATEGDLAFAAAP